MHFVTFERISAQQLKEMSEYFEPLASYALLVTNEINGVADVKIVCIDSTQYILNCFKEPDLQRLRDILKLNRLPFEPEHEDEDEI